MLDPSPPLDRRHKNFSKSVLQLMEKIPEEAESLTVMVGGVNFLQKPVVAFVRLAQVCVCANLQCLHNPSCSFKCYSIHCMCQTICDVTSSNFLGVLVQWEHKGEVGWYIHSKGENSTAVCGFCCKKSLSRVITQMVLETVTHLTGPPSVFKCNLLAG